MLFFIHGRKFAVGGKSHDVFYDARRRAWFLALDDGSGQELETSLWCSWPYSSRWRRFRRLVAADLSTDRGPPRLCRG